MSLISTMQIYGPNSVPEELSDMEQFTWTLRSGKPFMALVTANLRRRDRHLLLGDCSLVVRRRWCSLPSGRTGFLPAPALLGGIESC